MKFCPGCGDALTRLKTPDSWQSRWRCDGCGTRVQVTFGDAMGGSGDVTQVLHKPFDSEEPAPPVNPTPHQPVDPHGRWCPDPNVSANRAGKTRRTLRGMSDAVVEALAAIAYGGEQRPFTFLYVRPLGLPSVKVTVEPYTPDVKTEEPSWEVRDEVMPPAPGTACDHGVPFTSPCPQCKKAFTE